MKRTLFWLSIAMMSSASVFAQKSNVSKAGNLLYQDPVDYAKAQEYIEMAKMDSTTLLRMGHCQVHIKTRTYHHYRRQRRAHWNVARIQPSQ